MKNNVSVRKILQALFYIQSKTPENNDSRFNRVFLLKMLFAADRYHLRHYGMLATGDTYYAMKLGPVASLASDILKGVSININSAETCYLDSITEISENDVIIMSQNDDELSDSFKEALNFAIREFGTYSWAKLSDLSHCYPEWEKYKDALESGTTKRILMEIKDWFDNPTDYSKLRDCGKESDPFTEDQEFLDLLKEDYNADSVSI